MWTHPLVQFWVTISLAFFLMKSGSFSEWMVFAFILGMGIRYKKMKISWLTGKIRAYLIFLPIMLILYTCFSHWLSVQTLRESILTGLLAMVKLLSLIILMTVYLDTSKGGNFLHSLRSLWVETGLGWKWVDHLFIFLNLVFRFYPAIQMEWETMEKAQKAMRIPEKTSKIGKLSEILMNVPVLIVLYLRRSDLMAAIMEKRGYGTHFPRGIVDPVRFGFNHIFAIVLSTTFLMGADAIATV